MGPQQMGLQELGGEADMTERTGLNGHAFTLEVGCKRAAVLFVRFARGGGGLGTVGGKSKVERPDTTGREDVVNIKIM